jgi:putative restriction endonuclease
VDADLAARLSPDHLRRLEWFEEHAGQVGPRPEPLEGPLPLVHRQMGIYKPRDLEYATAIITMLESPYPGDHVTHNADGTWDMVYHQQDFRRAQTGAPYANAALRACVRDGIPVGVLEERSSSGTPRLFEVLGLAMPVDWQSDYFTFRSLNHLGRSRTGGTVSALLAAAEAQEAEEEQHSLPTDDYDARLRTLRQIVARRGQAAFRAALVDAYSGRCAVTGCDVPDVLEAAHLRPYRGQDSNDVRNGLLLRGDVHTLFDLRLLAIEPDSRTIVLDTRINGTAYQHLAGERLAEPSLERQRPSPEILQILWREYIGPASRR